MTPDEGWRMACPTKHQQQQYIKDLSVWMLDILMIFLKLRLKVELWHSIILVIKMTIFQEKVIFILTFHAINGNTWCYIIKIGIIFSFFFLHFSNCALTAPDLSITHRCTARGSDMHELLGGIWYPIKWIRTAHYSNIWLVTQTWTLWIKCGCLVCSVQSSRLT